MSTIDNKHLLLKSIALLLCESAMIDGGDNSAELVKRIVKDSVSPDMVIGRSVDSEVATALKKIAAFMAEMPPNHRYDVPTVVMDVKIACASDETITGLIERYLEVSSDESILKLKVINLRQSIEQHFEEKDLKQTLTKASMGLHNDRDSILNLRNYVTELVGKLEKYTVNRDADDPAVNFSLDLRDIGKTKEILERVQLQENGTHILQTGWQGINRMLDGGFRPGEQWVIGAQEHNWKTGFSLSLFRQIAQLNDGVCVRDETKKPALVRFSFEDSIEANIEFLYKSLWENESGAVLTEVPQDVQEVQQFITERMQARGWHVFLYDVNPSMWTYKSICNEILRLEARGYEVRLLMLDYLLKVPTTGCDQGPHGVDIRNLYERVKAFCAPRKITMVTPHQLAPAAKDKVREGTKNFVQEMVGGGYYSGTKQLGQVIDGELFINIETDGRGGSYLAIQRGKHRKIRQTPIEYRYIALKFVLGGVIPDDIGKADSTRLKIGGPTLGEIAESAVVGMDF